MKKRNSLIFLLSIFLVPISSYWHIYNEGLQVTGNCKTYSTNLTEIIQNNPHFKLWPGLVNSFDKKTGETIFGLKEAMDVIWENQHPKDCSKAKFLIAEGWIQGFGSDIHVTGVALAVALNLGRVFMMNPQGALKNHVRDNTWYTNNSYCRNMGIKSMECYYEPWTSCSFEDALGTKDWLDFRVHGSTYFSDTEFFEGKEDFIKSNEKTILIESRADAAKIMPQSLLPLLQCSNIPEGHQWNYWWRAISASYLLRPNAHTLSQFQHYQLDQFPLFNPEEKKCISIYVRRGDKHVEMPFVPVLSYLEGAKIMWETGLVPGPGGSPSPYHNSIQFSYSPLIFENHKGNSPPSSPSPSLLLPRASSKGTIFIGSEEPKVIEEAKKWGQEEGWEVLSSSLFDRRSVTTGLDWDSQKLLFEHQGERHHDLEYFSMLFDLHMHLRCSAFICTMASNWCRLIDELRATVGGKANRHYLDLTSGAPRIDDITDFYWRKI